MGECVDPTSLNLVWPDNPDFVPFPLRGEPRLAHVSHYEVISRMALSSRAWY